MDILVNEFPSPMGIFFISMARQVYVSGQLLEFPSPMGIFFISINFASFKEPGGKFVSVPYGDLFYFYKLPIIERKLSENLFPSPMGIFFISILSYGNLMEHSENLHFAVQRFSLLLSGDLKHFKVLYPLIICPAVQNYDSTSSIFPIP